MEPGKDLDSAPSTFSSSFHNILAVPTAFAQSTRESLLCLARASGKVFCRRSEECPEPLDNIARRTRHAVPSRVIAEGASSVRIRDCLGRVSLQRELTRPQAGDAGCKSCATPRGASHLRQIGARQDRLRFLRPGRLARAVAISVSMWYCRSLFLRLILLMSVILSAAKNPQHAQSGNTLSSFLTRRPLREKVCNSSVSEREQGFFASLRMTI